MKVEIIILMLVSTVIFAAPPQLPDFQKSSASEMARYYENRIEQREREQKEELREYKERDKLERIERKLDDHQNENLQ